MVTTRSAEKRIATTGKIEELAVRPKLVDPASSPTPSQIGSRKKLGIVVKVPPTSGTRAKPGDSALNEEVPITAEEESPYVTAKESPESFRDAIASFADVERVAPPTTLTPKRTVIPSSQETYTSLDDIDVVPPAGSRRSQDHVLPSGSGDPRSVGSVDGLPNPSEIPSRHRHTSSISTDDNENDQGPEITSIGRSGPSLSRLSKKRRINVLTSVEKFVVSPQVEQTRSQETLLPNTVNKDPQAQADDETSTNGKRSVLPSNVPTHQKTTRDAANSSASSSAPYGVKRKLHTSDNTFTLDQPSKPFAVSLPAKANKTLESFRQVLLVSRAGSSSKSRTRKFQLVDDWNSKRRKFVVAG